MKVFKFCSTSGFCSLCQLWAAPTTLLLVPVQRVQHETITAHGDTSTEYTNKLLSDKDTLLNTQVRKGINKWTIPKTQQWLCFASLTLHSSLTPDYQFWRQQLVVRGTNERLIHFCCQGQLVVIATGITGWRTEQFITGLRNRTVF